MLVENFLDILQCFFFGSVFYFNVLTNQRVFVGLPVRKRLF